MYDPVSRGQLPAEMNIQPDELEGRVLGRQPPSSTG